MSLWHSAGFALRQWLLPAFSMRILNFKKEVRGGSFFGKKKVVKRKKELILRGKFLFIIKNKRNVR